MRSGSRLTPTCTSCKNKAVRSASIFIAHRYPRHFFKLEHKAHVIPTMLHLYTVFMCSHYQIDRRFNLCLFATVRTEWRSVESPSGICMETRASQATKQIM